MARYFIDISYNGSNYHGWQVQANARTVQGEFQECLSKVLRVPTEIMGSGRTDTGVHAKQQIAHFESDEPIDTKDLAYKLNSILPDTAAVQEIRGVKADAHARFDATERAYQYFINKKKSPFYSGLSYYFSQPLDLNLMNEAAKELIGKQDFESFSKVKTEVNNFICTVTRAEWIIENDQLVFHVRANRFLRGMVRALVGTLLDVGQQKITVEDFVNIIKAKDRKVAGRAVPPHGLFLTEVKYPESIYL
ncbi:tRNA pseudouridine(38-40) synthase TruA [Roseivirga sp. E12]|uniref:tRNA pseudouridine(38-40) synthase TruA n=1 Tax=Roseivirga sp. E12 TaxID=2819237 RepID=UPI001ABD26C5|nr:tRNA pseudouridine(38-40) synthase TruA [Roseivirga sp. E12]